MPTVTVYAPSDSIGTTEQLHEEASAVVARAGQTWRQIRLGAVKFHALSSVTPEVLHLAPPDPRKLSRQAVQYWMTANPIVSRKRKRSGELDDFVPHKRLLAHGAPSTASTAIASRTSLNPRLSIIPPSPGPSPPVPDEPLDLLGCRALYYCIEKVPSVSHAQDRH
jgi:hypothetical protein